MTPRRSKECILVIDDSTETRVVMRNILRESGLRVAEAQNGIEGLSQVETQKPKAVLLDMILPDANGLGILSEIKTGHPDIPVIMVTGMPTTGSTIEAIKRGADDYIQKPFDGHQLVSTVKQVIKKYRPSLDILDLQRQLQEQNDSPLEKLRGTRSEAMKELLKKIGLIASDENAPVIITGEVGTERRLVAETIHQASDRSLTGEFVSLDTTAYPSGLLTKELFGHVPGGIPGGENKYTGILERADHGTLFVEELAKLDRVAQNALIQVLKLGYFYPLGANERTNVNIRIIAATTSSPMDLIISKVLDPELFYSLGQSLNIPPLRDRRSDIPQWTAHFLNAYKHSKGITEGALQLLTGHDWPGNLQEFENTLRQAVIASRRRVITEDMLEFPEAKLGYDPAELLRAGLNLAEIMDRTEKRAIEQALEQSSGYLDKTAAELGISLSKLKELMGIHHWRS